MHPINKERNQEMKRELVQLLAQGRLCTKSHQQTAPHIHSGNVLMQHTQIIYGTHYDPPFLFDKYYSFLAQKKNE